MTARTLIGLIVIVQMMICPVLAEVTVIDVKPGESGSQAGVESGDRILAMASIDGGWTQIEHPLDLQAMVFGPGRIGPLRLRLDSGQGVREIDLPLGDLGLRVVPGDGELARRAEAEFQAVASESSTDEALIAWTAAFQSSATDPRMSCWAQLRAVQLLVDIGDVDRATAEAGLLASVCEAAPVIDSVLARALGARALQERAEHTNDVVDLFESARSDSEALNPILRASLDHNLGSFLGRRGRFDEAEVALDRSIASFEANAPMAWGYSETLANRAVIDAIRGRLEDARAYLESAVDLMERIAPDSLALSSQQANLSIVLRRLGEPGRARVLAESALTIRQRMAPGSALVAQMLNNLGVLAKNRGDLVAAEDHYQRSLAIHEALESSPLARASVLGNLANLAVERLDPDQSLIRHREVLALLEPVAPMHRYVVNTRLALGQGELLRGQLDQAEVHLAAALELQESIGTEAPIYAAILEAFGWLARERGQTSIARERLNEALVLRRQRDPDSLDAAAVELALAEMDLAEGADTRALARLESAAEQAAARAPGSLVEARARHEMAGLHWRIGQRADALEADAGAIGAFERQRDRLGGDWLQRMRFGASQRDIYINAIERQLAAGNVEQAFALQERYRAYERRRLLAGRVPLPALDPASIPIDELAARLAPDEALLSWVVAERSTHAFLLTREGLSVQSLPQGNMDWRDEIDSISLLLSIARPTLEQRRALTERSQQLHAKLIAPWRGRLTSVRRLVLVPDQDLYRLPFAVIQEASTEAYVVERHALVYSASASLYLKPTDFSERQSRVVAVGDPEVIPEADASSGDSGSERVRGRGPGQAPLPAARAEVDTIASLFPERTLRLVGPDATEARVREAMPKAGLLHLAAHAVVDGARPLDAYLQLASSSNDDDGRLAAWEVLTQFDLEAELVTLSACSTARGRTLGGDGVLGLSQAFQIAGAQAVLATLWDVPDQATAILMAEFYRAMADGQDAADALRAAQVSALSRQRQQIESGWWRRLSRWLRGNQVYVDGPFEWAAFKLDGRVLSTPGTDRNPG